MNDKKQKILLAARVIFEEKGFHEAKISEIAHEAGIGKGTVYEYFSSKQALFEEMICMLIDKGFEHLLELINKTDGPVEKLNIIAKLESLIIKEHGKLFSLILVMMPNMSQETKKIFFDTRLKQLELIETIVEEGQEKGIFRSFNKAHFALIFKGTIMQVNMHLACPPFDMKKDVNLKEDIYQFLIDSIMS